MSDEDCVAGMAQCGCLLKSSPCPCDARGYAQAERDIAARLNRRCIADSVMHELAEALRELGRLGYLDHCPSDSDEETAVKQEVDDALARFDKQKGNT